MLAGLPTISRSIDPGGGGLGWTGGGGGIGGSPEKAKRKRNDEDLYPLRQRHLRFYFSMSKPEPIVVLFPIYPGVTHLDFTGPHQVLLCCTDLALLRGRLIGREGFLRDSAYSA